MNEKKDIFDSDRNAGLVIRMKNQYDKKRICELSNTYLTLSYEEIIKKVPSLETVKELEKTLIDLVKKN